jgi:branched-chain amino acid transport system ATP-binding protein
VNDAGTTVLLVEQNAYQALKVADRGYVYETGRVVVEGPASELLDDEKMREAYLGSSSDEAAGMSSVEGAFASAIHAHDNEPGTAT